MSAPVNPGVLPLAPATEETRTAQAICAEYGSDFVPPGPHDKAAVALATLDQRPLNARRITPELGNCGWYIWGGAGRSPDPGFFQSLQVAHLLERCPQIIPFLALAPGWRVRLSEEGFEIKAPHAILPPANVPPAAFSLPPSPSSRPPSVSQWLWLSILLHLLVIVLFGDTTGSGSRRGERLGGPLNVTLRSPTDRGADLALALRAETTLSTLDRPQSAARIAPPRLPANEAAPAETALPPSPQPAPEPVAAPVMPPVIAREVERPVTTFVVPVATPEPVALPEPPAARLPESLPRLDAIAAPKAIAPPMIERDIALPPELIPRLAPLVPARVDRETVVPTEAAPRPKAFVPPRIEPELLPPVELPRVAPLTPPRSEREIVRPAELLPRLAPVTPAPAIEAATPTELVPRLAEPVPASPAASTPAAAERAAEPARTSTPAARVAAPALPSASRIAPGVPAGAGDALAPRANAAAPVPAAPGSGSAPRIDLDAVRQRAREIAREGSGPRTLLPFNVKPKEAIKTKEQQAFDKALKRPDCRDAYSGLGLAAVVPLLWDAVSEKGCKW